jgi:O-antigen ligase
MAILAALFLGLLFGWLPINFAATLFAGIVIFLLIVLRPLFGIALALLVGPLGALEQLVFGTSSLDTGQVILIISLMSWLGHGLVRRRIRIPRTQFTLPLILFLLVGLISLLGAASIVLGMMELLKWLEIFLVLMLVVDLGQESSSYQNEKIERSIIGGPSIAFWLVGMLLLAGLSQALIGIWQFAFRGSGPEHFLVLTRFYRAYGTFEQPNPFGGFMNLSVLLALGILIGLIAALWLGRRRIPQSQDHHFHLTSSKRMFCLLLLVALTVGTTGIALLFSWSRGAWFGFAAGLVSMLLFLPRKRVLGFLLVGSLIVLVVSIFLVGLLPDAIRGRLTSFTQDLTMGDVRGVDINDENYSVLERQAHWQAGLEMFGSDVLLGVGFGNYALAYEDFALLNWPQALGHAHNYYVNLLAEVGMLGLVTYMIFWIMVFWWTISLLQILPWPDRGIGLGLLSVWVALAAHHLVDKLYVNNIYIHLGVLLGLLQLLIWFSKKVKEESKPA